MDLKKDEFVPRVTQLDAVDLDTEVVRVMKAQVVTASKYLKVGILGRWEPEIDAALRILIWKLSVNRLYATFGQHLLSVKYGGQHNRDKAILQALLTVGPSYVKERSREISRLAGTEQGALAVRRWLDWAETAAQLASLLNLLVFLQQGRYPTLPDRLLGLRPVSTAAAGQSRSVGYRFMLREMLWHGFIELLVFTLPLINYHAIRRKCVNLLPWQNNKGSSRRSVPFTTNTRCTICNESPILPHAIGCGHICCFYCIQANHLADPKFECPLCGYSNEDPTSIQPLQITIAS